MSFSSRLRPQPRTSSVEQDAPLFFSVTRVINRQGRWTVRRDPEIQGALRGIFLASHQPRSNALAPITRLPVEILAMIFQYLIRLDETEFSCRSLQRTRLMMVCHRWRSVIMDFATLWCSLELTSAQRASTMIRLSKASPLVVKFEPRDWTPVPEAVYLALCHLPRIRILHIKGPSESFQRIFGMMNKPMPLLESLFLSRRSDGVGVSPVLTCNFEGSTPRLRRFATFDFDVSWCSPLLHNLTHLEIRGNTLTPSRAEFRDVLSRCPALDTLIVIWGLPRADYNQSQAPVHLPQLSRLDLQSDLFDCDSAIRSIRFPQTTSVVIHCCISPAVHPTVLLAFVSHYSSASLMRHSRLRIAFVAMHDSIRFQAWASADDNPRDEPSLDLWFAGTQPIQRASFIHAFLKGLDTTELFSLHVDRFAVRGVNDSWPTIFGALENLQALTVTSLHIDELIRALKPFRRAGRVVGWKSPIPNLRDLNLQNAEFTSIRRTHLAACLALRSSVGAKLQTLRLFECISVSQTDVDNLERLADVVVWDGYADSREAILVSCSSRRLKDDIDPWLFTCIA